MEVVLNTFEGDTVEGGDSNATPAENVGEQGDGRPEADVKTETPLPDPNPPPSPPPEKNRDLREEKKQLVEEWADTLVQAEQFEQELQNIQGISASIGVAYNVSTILISFGSRGVISLPGIDSVESTRAVKQIVENSKTHIWPWELIGDIASELREQNFDWINEMNSGFNTRLRDLEKQARELRQDIGDPLVVDLDRDGVFTTASGVVQDLNDDQRLEQLTQWIGPGDALIVRDSAGDGVISGRDLTLLGEINRAPHELERLEAYDVNGDRRLSAADPIFSELRLWRDLNSNGFADQGELSSLSESVSNLMRNVRCGGGG